MPETVPKSHISRKTSQLILWGYITLTEKPDKDTTKRKLQANIHNEHKCKKSSIKYLETEFKIILKWSSTMFKWDLLQEYRDGSIFANQHDTPH